MQIAESELTLEQSLDRRQKEERADYSCIFTVGQCQTWIIHRRLFVLLHHETLSFSGHYLSTNNCDRDVPVTTNCPKRQFLEITQNHQIAKDSFGMFLCAIGYCAAILEIDDELSSPVGISTCEYTNCNHGNGL